MWDLDKYSNNVAIIEESGNQVTYKDLKNHCDKFSEHLSSRSLVFNLSSNSLGSLVGYVSFLNKGAVPLMLSSDIDDDSLANYLSKYRPTYIYAPDSSNYNLEGFSKVYSVLDHSLYKSNDIVETKLNPELALLLSTSGSTGSPKLVMQSYKNILANTNSIIDYLEITSSERAITSLPMSYTFGISVINTHLMSGASLVLTSKSVLQKEFWDLIKEHEVTSLSGVPYTYEMLDRLRFYRMKLPSLKTLTQAGGKLSSALHLKFAEFANQQKINFVVMYGQTEATARMAYLPSSMSIEKCGSIGIAIPGGEFKLINENGSTITESETVGELHYSGDNVTLGYAESAQDLCLGDRNQGNLLTGDMAKFDNDGFYFIVGRKKRFLKVFGVRINLDEIEQLIKKEFNHISCAASGIDDHMKIYIENSSLEEEIRKFVCKKLGIIKTALKVVAIDEIPKNEAGKILYSKLQGESSE